MYAVGLVLYEMLAGQRAFAGTTEQITELKQQVEKLVPSGGDVSPELAEIVARATACHSANARRRRARCAVPSRHGRPPT